jgi:hypothetical protein
MGRPTGLEPATLGTTNRCSNQLSYDRREGRSPSGARGPSSSSSESSFHGEGTRRAMGDEAAGIEPRRDAGIGRHQGQLGAIPTVGP